MQEEAPEGASATGTQGASSTQGAVAQGTPGEEEEKKQPGQPAKDRVPLRDIGRGFLRGDDGH